jgi:hypothetical protein
MSSDIVIAWQLEPPKVLIAGDGPYAVALASVFGTVSIQLAHLRAGPSPTSGGRYPCVFDDLKLVLLVVPEMMPAAEALRCHQDVWKWVEKLSSVGEHHELAFLFILPPSAPQIYEESLAVGLMVAEIDPIKSGHAVWRRSGSLGELLRLAGRTRPVDAVGLRRRRLSDFRYIALTRLRNVATEDDPIPIREAAMAVLTAFQGQEYHLDLFCRPPHHQNGSLFRTWLNAAVTVDVTHQWWADQRGKIAGWLAPVPTEYI